MLRRLIFMALAFCLFASSANAAPLHDAAIRGDVAQIKALLTGGADVNAKSARARWWCASRTSSTG